MGAFPASPTSDLEGLLTPWCLSLGTLHFSVNPGKLFGFRKTSGLRLSLVPLQNTAGECRSEPSVGAAGKRSDLIEICPEVHEDDDFRTELPDRPPVLMDCSRDAKKRDLNCLGLKSAPHRPVP